MPKDAQGNAVYDTLKWETLKMSICVDNGASPLGGTLGHHNK